MLEFNFDIQNCKRFVPLFIEISPAFKNSRLRAIYTVPWHSFKL